MLGVIFFLSDACLSCQPAWYVVIAGAVFDNRVCVGLAGHDPWAVFVVQVSRMDVAYC